MLNLLVSCPFRGAVDIETFSFRSGRTGTRLSASPPAASVSRAGGPQTPSEVFEEAKAALTESPAFYRHPYRNTSWQARLSTSSSGSSLGDPAPAASPDGTRGQDVPMAVTPPPIVYHGLPTVPPPGLAPSTKPPLNAEQDRFVKVAMQGTNLYVTGAAGQFLFYFFFCSVQFSSFPCLF